MLSVEGFSQNVEIPQTKQLFQIEEDGAKSQQSGSLALQTIKAAKKTKHITHISFPDSLYKYNRFDLYFDLKTERIVDEAYPNAIKLMVQRTDVQVLDGEKGYSWIGSINSPDAKQAIGSIHLVNTEQQIGGSVDIEGATFEIQPLGNAKDHVLVQHDKEYRGAFCGIVDKDGGKHQHIYSEKSNANSSTNSVTPCSQVRQSVLVVYTASAANGRNMPSMINTAIQETNEIYANSQISNVRVKLAHTQQVSFNETDDIDDDIDSLQINTQISSLRSQYDADLVILIVDTDGYSGGIASTILATDTSEVFALTDVNDMNSPDYLFAHELGHLQGAQHHPDDPTEAFEPFSYGFGHRFSYISFLNPVRKKKATVMAYRNPSSSPFPKSYERIKYFSNPNVIYRGKTTGIANERDNHRVLENTAVQIANFANPNELNANIIVMGDNISGYNFIADACGGTASLSYEWRFGSSFNSYGSIVSTSSSFSSQLPSGTTFVKLTVSSGNKTAIAYYTLYVPEPVEPCDPFSGEPCDVISKQTVKEDDNLPIATALEVAYPNPFNPSTNISYSLAESQNIKIEVYNLNGARVAILAEGSQTAGQYSIAFNAQNLPSGTYIVRMLTEQKVFTQKITLIK